MKLQQQVADCNKNIPNKAAIVKIVNNNSYLKPAIKAPMLNADVSKAATNISADNILIPISDEMPTIFKILQVNKQSAKASSESACARVLCSNWRGYCI